MTQKSPRHHGIHHGRITRVSVGRWRWRCDCNSSCASSGFPTQQTAWANAMAHLVAIPPAR